MCVCVLDDAAEGIVPTIRFYPYLLSDMQYLGGHAWCQHTGKDDPTSTIVVSGLYIISCYIA